MEGEVTYGLWTEAWSTHLSTVKRLIEGYRPRRVCDVGGGANPLLSAQYVADCTLDYTLLDISAEELAKAPQAYRKVRADISAPDLVVGEQFDLILSKMLAEHVRDGGQFHRNVFKMLAPGGIAFHFFPTLYCPPFVVNRLLPERLTKRVLNLLAPRSMYQYAKFPAYYSWCRGPTKMQLRRFEALGYAVVDYRGFFGHQYYQRLSLLHMCSVAMARSLARVGVPILTSFAYLILSKPRKASERSEISRG